MAKVISGPNGERMIVSDDMPEDVGFGNETEALAIAELPTVLDPASILLCFDKEEYPVIPVQTNTYLLKKDFVKLAGVMLLADFAWLAEQVDATLDHLEIRMDHRAFRVGVGPYKVDRLVGKDMNATTVSVHLSLKKHS